MVELARLRWSGHIVRTGDERYSRMTWQTRIERKRPRGRPRDTWEKKLQRIFWRKVEL